MNDETKSEQQTEAQKEELAVYEKLRQRMRTLLTEARETITADTVSHALDRATKEMKELGEHSSATISRVRDTFKKDINSTVQAVRPRLDKATEDAERAFHAWRERGGALWHELGEHSAQVYEVSRDKGGAFVAVLARAFGEWSQNVGSKLDQRLVYHTGEATHGGSFVCMSCEAAIKMRKPGHLPPCPKCHKTEFRRA